MISNEEYIRRCEHRLRYNLVVQNSRCSNIAKVNPIKQMVIDRLYNYCEVDNSINKVIIFGSAITDRCKFSSDIDICVDWNMQSTNEDGCYTMPVVKSLKGIQHTCNCEIDIIPFDQLDTQYTKIKNNVLKGVTIYERTV